MNDFQSCSLVISAILSLGSCGAAFAAAWNARVASRTLKRLCDRDRPKATLNRDYSGSFHKLVVSNVGCVPFTVLSIGSDGRDFLPFTHSLVGDRCPATVLPGGFASFDFHSTGTAFVRLADGTVVTE